ARLRLAADRECPDGHPKVRRPASLPRDCPSRWRSRADQWRDRAAGHGHDGRDAPPRYPACVADLSLRRASGPALEPPSAGSETGQGLTGGEAAMNAGRASAALDPEYDLRFTVRGASQPDSDYGRMGPQADGEPRSA